MADQKLSMASKITYGTGTFTITLKDVAFGSFVLFYYVSVVGLPGRLAGLVLFIAMAWDAISDPLIGSLSDRYQSRWGRRHPFMLIGGVPLALSLWALFVVPEGLSQWQIFTWMLVCCLCIRTFLTIFAVPYLALGAELSTDYQERSSIAAVRTVIGWTAGLTTTAFAWGALFSSDGQVDGRLITDNYASFGLLSFVLVAVFSLLSTFGTRKHIPHLPKVGAPTQGFGVKALYQDVVFALRNDNFRTLFYLLLTLGAATGLSGALGTHMMTYFWELSTEQLTWLTALGLAPILLMSIALPWLNRTFEKQVAVQLSILGLVLNAIWFVPGRLLGLLPENGTDALFLVVVLNAAISVCCIMWFHTVSASVIADVSDEHEFETDKRQEGMFFAAQGFSNKFVTGAGALLGGVVVDLVGLPAGAAPGTVADDVLFNMGLFMGPLLAVFLFVPYLIARRLNMSRAKHEEIRTALEQRAT